ARLRRDCRSTRRKERSAIWSRTSALLALQVLGRSGSTLMSWTRRSHLVSSARLLHPPDVAEVGRGQDRVSSRRATAAGAPRSESGSERRGDTVLAQLVRRGAQQAPVSHGSTTGAIASARDAALLLPPKADRDAGLGHA